MASPYRDAPSLTPASPRVAVRWVPREVPLAVRAVAAQGSVAVALRDALLRCDDRALGRWRGVATETELVILGDDPPWVDGAVWLGRDPEVPGWYVPTAERVDVPAALWVRAISHEHPGASHAVWPTAAGLRVVPVVEARPLSRARLAGWSPR